MEKIITEDEIQAIAEAFADYDFSSSEKGLYYLCKGRQGRMERRTACGIHQRPCI